MPDHIPYRQILSPNPVRFGRSLSGPGTQPGRMIAAFWMLPIVMTIAGCSLMHADGNQQRPENTPPTVPPDRIIAAWSDTVLSQAGKAGIRGFGGRLMFYREDADQPLRVDGSVIVYAWLEATGSESHRAPDRKYVVTADQLSEHYSRSRLGHSYSFWVPWEKAGGPHRQITLITRFVGRNGGEVISSSSRSVLPGPSEATATPSQPTEPTEAWTLGAQSQRTGDTTAVDTLPTESHHASERHRSAETRSRTTTSTTSTIDVPAGFAKRNLTQRDGNDRPANVASRAVRSTEPVDHFIPSKVGPVAPANSRQIPATDSRSGTEAEPSQSSDGRRVGQHDPQQIQSVNSRESATRFGRGRFQGRTTPSIRPGTAGVRRQPLPAKSQHGLPPTPRSQRTVPSRSTAAASAVSPVASEPPIVR